MSYVMQMAMQMVSVLLQDRFVDLLKKLPDDYFKLDEAKKAAFWKDIWIAIDRGENDLDNLAGLVTIWL
jgi:hypothetical protein